MTNRMTMTQYHALKNQTFTYIAFNDEERASTHSGLSLVSLVFELMQRNGRNQTWLIFPDGHPVTKDLSHSREYFLTTYATEIAESRNFLKALNGY